MPILFVPEPKDIPQGWEVVSYNPDTFLTQVGDRVTLHEVTKDVPYPEFILSFASEEFCGTSIQGWKGRSLGWLCNSIDEHDTAFITKLMIVWRRTNKRVYKPSIFAEPVPLP